MHILVTGCRGQVGTELCLQAKKHSYRITACDLSELDISNNIQVQKILTTIAPDIVINAAAYTAVDKAESDSVLAYAVNRDGPANLASSCDALGIPFIHYSTDYVFDGSQQTAYVETDNTAPLGIYGVSKLAGEIAVQKACKQHFILRTSWVFSAHGNNFVKTMLRIGQQHQTLRVVSDQFGCPTSAAELARLTLVLLDKINSKAENSIAWGCYHLAQPCSTSWHGFANAIFAEARQQGMDLAVQNVAAITTADYPTPAQRPQYSTLNTEKLSQLIQPLPIRPWQESLVDVIADIIKSTSNNKD
ncbi:MAG: dTDP-4-dehydrorhamnose reductase [Mariprofundales bacterium]